MNGQPDALSQAILQQRPDLAGQVHYVDGRPWCDGVNHTTRCEPNICEAAVPTGGDYGAVAGWLQCGQPATAHYRYACVHEHVRERWTCPAHEPEPGSVGCRACAELGHPCDMEFARL